MREGRELSHAHRFVEVGPRRSVELARSQCSCGESRIDVIDTESGRRTGLVVPLSFVRAAQLGRDVLVASTNTAAVVNNLMAFWDQIRGTKSRG